MPSTVTVATPTRLAIFALEQGTTLPIARMPVYAEIVVRSETEEPPAKVDGKLDDPILLALRKDAPENLGEPQPRQRLADVISQEIARQFGPKATAILATVDPPKFIASVINEARKALGGALLRSLDRDTLKQALRVAIREEAGRLKLSLEPPTLATPALWAYPLGVLATDHTGYLSYDLSGLPASVLQSVTSAVRARRRDPAAALDVSISIYPTGLNGVVFDALPQGRFTLGAIVARIEIEKPLIPDIVLNLALPSMQNPSLGDWRLSPGSFATNPGSLVGADGCESILPANVALQEFYLYQVVRLTDVAPPVAPVKVGQVQLGIINEYRVAWHSLGHSLGQILYSLPLAPGESVNLAVIDWTRRDEAQRKERTTVDEQLVHNEHRDRVVSETVDAAVREYQHGSSFMGGIAGAFGGSNGAVSGGVAGSLGGSTSNSSGNRTVTATTVQRVSDNITQVSSASRELQSTVVVQAVQSETENIETRTVVNYNHSHALTILYYEVLRHFRVLTELVRRRPAVLVKMKTDWFEGEPAARNILEHRRTLESALLDARFAGGFGAIEGLSHRGKPFSDFTTPLPPPPVTVSAPPPVPVFRFFEFEMTTGGFHRPVDAHDHGIDIRSSLLGKGGAQLDLTNIDGGPVLNSFGAFSEEFKTNVFVTIAAGGGDVRWDSITSIALVVAVHPDDDDTAKVSFSRIKLTALDDVTGRPGIVLLDQSYENGHLIFTNSNDENGRRRVLPTLPAPQPPVQRPFYAPSDVAGHEEALELIAHLNAHRVVYSRAILLNQNPLERAAEFDAVKLADGSNVLEKMENRPIEVIGEYMAFPSTDRAWEDKISATFNDDAPEDAAVPDERLVALPTRGVFAETKLGHCNASEPIDNTRFWDWQQSPIPHMAPEIAPITAVTPQPQQQNLGATPLPSSIVNIVNPPNAPDPTGMAAAMGVLSASNIFRDMSGRSETADVLKNLADNAVKIAAVASGGRAGAGGSLGPGSRISGSGSGGVGGPRAMPNQPSVTNRDLQDLGQVLGRAQADNLITPDAAQGLFTQAAQDAYASKSTLAFSVDATTAGGAELVTLKPLHADEADETLISYEFGQYAIIVPQAVLLNGRKEIADVNVHVFFAAGGVLGEVDSDVLVHGLRGASNQSDWVTIAVRGIADGANPISEAQILDCLRAIDIKGGPKSLRLSGHSRGTDSLVASVSATGFSNLLNKIDRVTFLDEAVEHVPSFLADGKTPNPDPKAGMVRLNRVETLQKKVPADRMVSYEVSHRSEDKGPAKSKSRRIAGATYIELGPDSMAAIGCVRLIQDALQLRPDIPAKLAAKPALEKLVGSVVLPARGSFTTKGEAGKRDLATFFTSDAKQLADLIAAANSLLAFVNREKLTSYAVFQFDWWAAGHHLFVAEIAHELTD